MWERRETIRRLLDARGQMNFQYELQAGQLPQVDRELAAYGSIDSADALALLDRNEDELLRYLYYTSARCIRRLEEPKYDELMEIVRSPDTDKERVTQFNKYISEPENLKKLLRVFPIVATTCISAHRLGDPEPSFDMVIMDEASQCSTAMSLVPILRGASLMLVATRSSSRLSFCWTPPTTARCAAATVSRRSTITSKTRSTNAFWPATPSATRRC